MSITTERVFRTGDVWLCERGNDLEPLTIREISKGHIRHTYAWESAKDFNEMAKTRLGKARYFLGIQFGYSK